MTKTDRILIERLVREAVTLWNGKGAQSGIFNIAGFQQVVRREFDLQKMQTYEWCRNVLSSLPCVEQLEGGCHWRYRPGRGSCEGERRNRWFSR